MIELVCIVPDLCQEKLRDINHPVALLRLWWLHNIFPVDISERFIDQGKRIVRRAYSDLQVFTIVNQLYRDGCTDVGMREGEPD